MNGSYGILLGMMRGSDKEVVKKAEEEDTKAKKPIIGREIYWDIIPLLEKVYGLLLHVVVVITSDEFNILFPRVV